MEPNGLIPNEVKVSWSCCVWYVHGHRWTRLTNHLRGYLRLEELLTLQNGPEG